MEDFIQHVEQIIARNPYAAQGMVSSQQDSHPARYHVGMALVAEATGDQAALRNHVEQAVALIDGDLPARVEALRAAAEATGGEDAPNGADGDGEADEAVALPENALQVVPDDLEELFSRAALGTPGRHPIDDQLDAWEQLPLAEAEAAVEAVDADADPVAAALGRALIAARRGDRDGFAEEVEVIEEQHPDHPRVRSFMVAVDADLMPANALEAARALLEDDDSGRSWEALGSTLFLMGRLQEAAKAFEIASMRDVESTFILRAMAACEARIGDPIEALMLIDEACEEEPLDPSTLHMARDIIRQLGWAEGALRTASADLEERELDDVTAAMLEVFMVLVAFNPRARVLDPESRDPEGFIEALQGRNLPEAVQARIDALLEMAEAADEEGILAAWSMDEDAPLLFKLRHQLARGSREEAEATAEELTDAYDRAVAQGLLAIDAGATDEALRRLAEAFTARPDASAPFVALQALYAGLGEGVGSLALGEFIEAIEEAPHGLVARAMVDTASWALPRTPEALADELLEDACAFFADLLSGDFDDLEPEVQAQLVRRGQSLGEDFIASALAEAEYEAELNVEGVEAEAAEGLDDEDRAATLLRVLRPAFRAVTDELVEAERAWLEQLGRADRALELQARHTMVI